MAYDYRELGGVPISSIDITSGKKACYVAIITPLDAQILLDKNVQNRRISDNTVYRYALMMDRGEWDWCDGDVPLKFGEGGILRNGQHRLRAQIAANVTGAYDIRTGVPEESYKVMDTGKPRIVADFFYGKEYAKEISAAAGRIMLASYGHAYRSGSYTGTSKDASGKRVAHGLSNRETRAEVIEFAQDHYQELVMYVNLGNRIRKQTKRGGSAVYAAALYIDRIPIAEAEAFVTDFVEGGRGTDITKQTVLKKLVEKSFKPKPEWFAGVILLAYDAWKRDHGIKTLRNDGIYSRYVRSVEAYSEITRSEHTNPAKTEVA